MLARRWSLANNVVVAGDDYDEYCLLTMRSMMEMRWWRWRRRQMAEVGQSAMADSGAAVVVDSAKTRIVVDDAAESRRRAMALTLCLLMWMRLCQCPIGRVKNDGKLPPYDGGDDDERRANEGWQSTAKKENGFFPWKILGKLSFFS
jgi:hypothetical protein